MVLSFEVGTSAELTVDQGVRPVLTEATQSFGFLLYLSTGVI